MAWKNESEAPDVNEPGWERRTLERVAMAQVEEQRRARRWGIFFKLLFLGYLIALLFLVRGVELPSFLSSYSSDSGSGAEHIAVIDVEGVISTDSPVASAALLNRQLRAAFGHEGTRAVMLRINSGGGSPVQSAIVYDEIRRLRELHDDIPVYAVIADVGASGAYYIAAAADEIYASPASLVGSIGVRMDSFGLVDLINGIGVERRLFTAGENKALLDPFLPLQAAEVQHIDTLLQDIHQQFIDAVRTGRGERLNGSEDLFTGLIWSGREAVALGLTDGLGTDRSVARDVIGVERLVDFSPRVGLIRMLLDEIGIQMSLGLTRVLSEPRLH